MTAKLKQCKLDVRPEQWLSQHSQGSCAFIWWSFTCWLEPYLQNSKGHKKINLSYMHCNYWVMWKLDQFSFHFLQLWGSMHLCHLKCNNHFCFVLEHIYACLRFRKVFFGFHGQSWVEVVGYDWWWCTYGINCNLNLG